MKDINGPWARAPQLVCAILFAAFFNHAIGQTDDSTIDEVVVTAKFQASLADAISQKRSAATQLEAIGLENIGVLPAVSIADAIATLPGVAGARTDDGNIGELSVRGTTDLTLGLLNGREQVTVSSNRNVEYGLYPPSVMTSVQVHKTPIAMMPEGGLSGIINMRTIRPMDFDDRSITVNADLGTYGIGDDTFGADDFGGQFNVTYIDQLSDAFGIALSAAYANEPLGRESAVTPFEWRAFTGGFGAPADV
ncbi:MAG: TonB-dependent receptor plug domain-containing protein, partial [Pseudomonadota bacterium]